MASCAPNARSLDCERLEHDPDDLDRNGERARSMLPFIWVNNERQKSDPERSELYGERTHDVDIEAAYSSQLIIMLCKIRLQNFIILLST